MGCYVTKFAPHEATLHAQHRTPFLYMSLFRQTKLRLVVGFLNMFFFADALVVVVALLYLTESVYQVVLPQSISAQIRQSVFHYHS